MWSRSASSTVILVRTEHSTTLSFFECVVRTLAQNTPMFPRFARENFFETVLYAEPACKFGESCSTLPNRDDKLCTALFRRLCATQISVPLLCWHRSLRLWHILQIIPPTQILQYERRTLCKHFFLRFSLTIEHQTIATATKIIYFLNSCFRSTHARAPWPFSLFAGFGFACPATFVDRRSCLLLP